MRNFFANFCRHISPAGGLTYRPTDRNALTAKLIDLLVLDSANKGLAVPEYIKEPFALTATTPDGKVVGRCSGYSAWGELHISLLAANPVAKVPEAEKALMYAVEKLARERACSRLALVTFSWQARPFYERFGFSVFGTQIDYPVGHEKYFMEKHWDHARPMDTSLYGSLPQDITVAASNQTTTQEALYEWLDNDTQNRQIPGVPPYEMKEFALEALFPDGTFAAGAVYETVWGEMHISFLGTHGEKKGCGLGTTVLRHLERIARDDGCSRLSLETMSWQAQSYEKHGFCVLGRQENLPLPTTARIYLEKIL